MGGNFWGSPAGSAGTPVGSGFVTLVNGVGTINDPLITPTSKITLSVQNPIGTLGNDHKAVAGSGSATVTAITLAGAASSLDNSVLQYHIVY